MPSLINTSGIIVIVFSLMLVVMYRENNTLKQQRLNDTYSQLVATEEQNRQLAAQNKLLEERFVTLEEKITSQKQEGTLPLVSDTEEHNTWDVVILVTLILMPITGLGLLLWRKRIEKNAFNKINRHLAQRDANWDMSNTYNPKQITKVY